MSDILNTGLQTTDKQCYFLCVDTKERLEIQFVPKELDISRDADLDPVKIVGRNTPKYQYLGGETLLNFELDFYADEESRSSVIRKCNWLMSLTHNNRGRQPSKRVALIFGDVFKYEIWKVKSVNHKISDFSKPHAFLPKQAYVAITLCLDMDYNLGWEDINVNYGAGSPDGSNPVFLGPARQDDDDLWDSSITNDNTFRAIAARAFERLGLLSTFTNGILR